MKTYLSCEWIWLGVMLWAMPEANGQGELQNCYGDLDAYVKETDVAGHNPNTYTELDPRLLSISQHNTRSYIQLDCVNVLGAYTGSHLKHEYETILIIPGYRETCNDRWVEKIANGIHAKAKVNIVCLDWSKGSSAAIPYRKALANAKFVGKLLADVLKHLEKTYAGIIMKFYLIASGLGSSIAAFTGKTLEGQMGRITGLNPWGLYITGYGEVLRLNKTDAKFVDVIHTDTAFNGVGDRAHLGHIDFYPNGGEAHPGCSYLDTVRVCQHKLSQELYIESLGNGCPLFGFKCKSFKEFLLGDCWKKKALMGYPAMIRDASKIPYFSLTAATSPFIGKHLELSFHYRDCRENQPPYSIKLDVIFKDYSGLEIGHTNVLDLLVLTSAGGEGDVKKVVSKPIRQRTVSFFIKCNHKPTSKRICLNVEDIKTKNLVTHVEDEWSIQGTETEIQCGREYRLELKRPSSRNEL